MADAVRAMPGQSVVFKDGVDKASKVVRHIGLSVLPAAFYPADHPTGRIRQIAVRQVEARRISMPPRISDNYEPWNCPTCGALVRSTVEACPFCGTTADGVVPPTFLAVLGRFLGSVLLICLGWTAFFALCGFIGALITGDWEFMAVLTIFGVVAGILFGIGGQIIQAVRDRQERTAKSSSGRGKRAMVGAVVLGMLGIAMLSFARSGKHRRPRALARKRSAETSSCFGR